MVFPRQRQSRTTAARLSIQSLTRWWSTRRCWSPRTLRHMLSIWLSQMVVLGMLPQCDRWPKAFLISGLVRTGNLTTLDQPWKKSGTSIQMYIYIYTPHIPQGPCGGIIQSCARETVSSYGGVCSEVFPLGAQLHTWKLEPFEKRLYYTHARFDRF